MARKRNLIREAERYSQFLLFEATGGAMGREPVRGKSAKEGEFPIDFQTKRALLDSLIKLASVKAKVSPEDEDEDGIAAYKEMLNVGSGTDRDTGIAEPPAAGNPAAPPIHGHSNGRATDFLE
jgi:hypothetical protein